MHSNGAIFSVALAQAVTSAVLRQEKLPFPSSLLSVLDSRLIRRSNIISPYIDDINAVGTSAARVNQDRNKADSALDASHLATDPKREFSANYDAYKEAIGLAWWKEGVLTVKHSLVLRLFRTTNPIEAIKQESPSQIWHIVGMCTYALLLRHPSFSILYHAFEFMDEGQPNKTRRVPDPVGDELGALLDIFPLLFTGLSLLLSARI